MARIGYLGNTQLKPTGHSVEYTKEQIEEYIKCSRDYIYFVRTYCKIVSIDKGLVNFDLYPYQEELMKVIDENRFTIVKACRQSGKSTTTVIYFLWKILFTADYKIAILANKGHLAREILSRVKKAYEHLPKWLQQGIVSWNKGDICLENGSKIIAAATSSSAIRGDSMNCISMSANITIRNKHTGKIETITGKDLFERAKSSK